MVAYAWRSDKRYYFTVVNRYYRQVSLPFHLGVQAVSAWIVTSAVVLGFDIDLVMRCIWLAACVVFGLVFPYLVRGVIVLKFRLRPTFGAETTFKMADTEVLITGPGAGHFPWSVYDRAVSFSDVVLLVSKGGIRWLPHEALREGTPAQALGLVQSHLPVRALS